ncbi:leucyl aminopeptidase [Jiangella asiatica]|uniref:Probable cytosol aminopeptidase n=1 Tax=Jiangella asiatica TaxID=2530372 RepID=A0A4R5DR12_9ACTN|nr:leucyl aminopeptidase [Jiangella asiatica]TDE13465.1 leucyl aminopeptidase [Jiangella asiatica]
MTSIALSSAAPTGLKVDAVVIGVAPGDDEVAPLPGSESVSKAFKGALPEVLGQLGATGKPDEVTKLPAQGSIKAPLVVAIGTGPLPPSGPDRHETLRRAAGAAARALAGKQSAAVALPVQDEADAAAVVEGLLLGAYRFDRYKSNGPTKPLGSVTVLGPGVKAKGVKDAVTRAEIVTTAVNRARDWVNVPPRDLTPEVFADAASKLARSAKLDVEILDEKLLARRGYGGLIGVGQGSANPPRLVRVAYRPSRAKRHVAFVGKGITFDSGGLSLKPSDSMADMKSDMSGAAAVIAAVHAIASLGTKVAVTAYAAMAENMPSGSAQRPSDVISIYGGKTVEVLNTDAEGRLVLADGIVRAAEDEPDLIVDVATLTGAAVVALGKRLSGIMANDDDLRDRVHDASRRAGEQMWPLPLPTDLRDKLDSPVADIANIGDRWGGALQAGLFLQEFVADGIDWAHLDIAGPALSDTAFGYTPKGGTGAGVRTLVRLVEDVADGVL